MSADRYSDLNKGPEPGGYFTVMGWIQILLGAFHLFFSLFGLYFFLSGDALRVSNNGGAWLPFQNAGETSGVEFGSLTAIYLALQVIVGWLLGALTIWAGVETKNARRWGFVKAVAVANLFFFPLGTTVGALVLISIHRPEIKERFAPPQEPTIQLTR